MWIIPISIMVGIVILERFNVLSKQLQEARINCSKHDIDELISKHEELCHFIEQINDKWGEYFFILFGVFIYLVAFLINATIFNEISSYIRIHILLIFLTVLSIALAMFYSFALARISYSAYDSFQEIRKLSVAPLELEEKLKILDFMKKFRENEIGFNCGGYFLMSKESPIKVYNALYTVCNMLLQIRDILWGEKRSCIPTTNPSTFPESFHNISMK
ncbi:uncharacterized protein [Centruroides vittatus]|uniref:uncharacterized protein n=1 Tax=Centruroides vittatus TaxID=120091 RepID=UPI00350EFC5A